MELGKIEGKDVVICIMDSGFLMGSMGTVVGEKITYAIEKAIELKYPIIIFTVSGGARMQEGIMSLMQMAKTTSAISKLNEAGGLYISVLTDPTYGGVTASFASIADIVLSEPGAMIGFAGQRVIEQTIGESLPDGFQTAEFLLEHGFIDKIVERKDLKHVLGKLIELNGWFFWLGTVPFQKNFPLGTVLFAKKNCPQYKKRSWKNANSMAKSTNSKSK